MSSSTLRLRPWQRRALDIYQTSNSPDFLAVATPGAGKTTFALTVARLTLPRLNGRLVVVAPTRHLKQQWADAAQRFGLHLVTNWSSSDGLPPDIHGVVTTYQQVGGSPEPFFRLSHGGFVIMDEVHHAGQELSWGDGVTQAFAGASRRLALSGTPFRSDTQVIPFVRYEAGQVVPDVEYGYGEALADGRVVRPVYFPRFGGHMEWTTPDGNQVEASFDDPLARTQANQRLRVALSLDGEWLTTVLGHAHKQLKKIREVHTDAGGLVIAKDQEHAQGIARLMRDRFNVNPDIAVSDDADASDRIAKFAGSSKPWIIAVRMISEGVDIPRLRVGVYATTTTTELFFRQAVGRIVRFTPGQRSQRAYMFLPDDPRLRHWGTTIAQSRRHSLKKSDAEDDDSYGNSDENQGLDELVDDSKQMSLFAVLSATASEPAESLSIFDEDEAPEPEPEPAAVDVGADELVIDLAALPPAIAGVSGIGVDRVERDRLRRQNADLARQLVEITNKPHSAVNFELNRLSGVSKVSEASSSQLIRRVQAAEEWIRREQRRQRMAKFV